MRLYKDGLEKNVSNEKLIKLLIEDGWKPEEIKEPPKKKGRPKKEKVDGDS